MRIAIYLKERGRYFRIDRDQLRRFGEVSRLSNSGHNRLRSLIKCQSSLRKLRRPFGSNGDAGNVRVAIHMRDAC